MGAASVAPVVVGVDGSGSSLTAVRLAAREAAAQNRPLRVVHALDWDQYEAAAPEGGLRRSAEELLRRAVALATRVAPELETSMSIVEGSLLTAALREARTAPLIVVNDGGLAAQTCLPIDACAVQVAARAACCVLIARKVAHSGGPILVGVDGSSGSDQALGMAFEAAANHDAELVIVRAWRPESTPAGDDARSEAQLADGVALWQEKYPSVLTHRRTLRGEPATVLLHEAAAGRLVVVAARSDNPGRGLLGPVCQTVLHRSPCPVLVVRGVSRTEPAPR